MEITQSIHNPEEFASAEFSARCKTQAYTNAQESLEAIYQCFRQITVETVDSTEDADDSDLRYRQRIAEEAMTVVERVRETINPKLSITGAQENLIAEAIWCACYNKHKRNDGQINDLAMTAIQIATFINGINQKFHW